MEKTPIKQANSSLKLCIVCAQTAKYPRKVGAVRPGANASFNIKELLEKYGNITVESGTMCRACTDKLISLHKKNTAFLDLCQSGMALRQTTLRGKRMASSGMSPVSSFKRQDISDTPKSMKQRSKIPTPVSKHKSVHDNQNKNVTTNRKRLFWDKSSELNGQVDAEETQLFVGMEIEIDSTTNEKKDVGLLQEADDKIVGTEAMAEHFRISSYEKSNRKGSRTETGLQIHETACGYEQAYEKSAVHKGLSVEQPIHHDYIKSQKKPSKFNRVYEDIRKYINEYRTNYTLTEEEAAKLVVASKSRDVAHVCKTVLSMEGGRKCIIRLLMDEIDKNASQVTGRKHSTSILMQKSLSDLKTFDWFAVVEEFKTKFPELLGMILASMVKPENQRLYTGMEKIIPRLGAVYGILMQGRDKELSLIQRLNSSLLFDNICDVKVFDRLHKQGICLSYSGSLYVMESIGGRFNDTIIELVQQRRRFRLIGDNINWTVGVHDQRMDYTSHMEHTFGSAVLIQNVNFNDCVADRPLRNFETTPCQEFLPSAEDYDLYRKDYTVLMSRVVFQYLPYFQTFAEVIPDRLSQPCDASLGVKTKVVPLPVLYKNEQKHQDVVEILAFYESTIIEACDAAGIDSADVFIHIGGDQLTRERFSQAKTLRAHEDSPRDRFENLSPITFEFFHMHMNFLAMAFKTLYDEKSVQDTGTLRYLQNRISRSNVGVNVNTHYDADKDFFISVVDVHIVECFMEFFGMTDVTSAPTKNIPPDFQDADHKKLWYFQTVGDLLDQLVFPSSAFGRDTDDSEVEGTVFEVLLPDGRNVSSIIPKETKQIKPDYILNYAKRLLELGLHFKDLLDATKLPERSRHISLLKQTMLFFKSHKNKSKYAYEILRLLVHQICILSERAANEEFYALFVNTNGHFDGHIPADRRMEYLVKKVKEHIKHMYSNKTETNVKKRSSAIAGIGDVGERYDSVSNVRVRTHKHSNKSSHGDELILLESLRTLRPFSQIPGRHHIRFPNMTSSLLDTLDIQHYHEWIKTRKTKFATELGN